MKKRINEPLAPAEAGGTDMRKTAIDRRHFIKISALGSGSLVLGFVLPGFGRNSENMPCDHFQPNAFIRIDKTGQVTIFVARQEMGQGVNTSLPMIVAEELEVDFQTVRQEIAPFGSLPEGAHDTGGSQSVTGSYAELRKAGAVAKTMLVAAAAKKWGVDPNLCKAENGVVTHVTTGNSIGYGDLVCDAAELPVPTEVTLKNVKDFKIVGKGQRKKNLKDIITGQATYGMDLKVPGMLYAVVERSPVLGGTVENIDAEEALAVPGVVRVVSYNGTGKPMHARAGVAVLATNIWAAIKGRRLLNIKWNEGEKNKDSTAELFRTFAELAKKPPQKTVHTAGDVNAVNASKANTLNAEYAAPFLAHAMMEPLNYIAAVKGDQCELWGGLQLPHWTVETIAKECGILKNNIRVNLALMGGAFGRRLMCDFALETVKIAQQVDKPVKVIWDRTDDIRFDNYRPANYHRLEAKWDEKGILQSWEHHVLSTPISWMTDGPGTDTAENLGGAEKDFWYAVPNVKTAYTPVDFNLHRGWLRGVEPVQNVFAVECFIDEVAQKLKKDPLQYRLGLLEGRESFKAYWDKIVEPQRLAGVLKLAAEKIGWDQPRKKNHFMGIAGHMFFCDSYAAHAIEIERLGPKKFRLVRIIAAIDCGLVINPDGLKNQMEGGTVFGLGQALKNEITVENSRVVQDGFFNYELARFSDVPDIEIHTVKSDAPPGGVGEVGVATVSPALCNALAAAGNRPRTLPIKNEGFTWE
ncbi:MAG: xanthine dehydrogenase family protein molybdopterin-binding subunit [Lewinellaceae bacterium]|nr:xanthine dehydrogenase family protein molybdopterin-binding subunit [Lewinellaceae bacterium]